jgi:hypothetical protein
MGVAHTRAVSKRMESRAGRLSPSAIRVGTTWRWLSGPEEEERRAIASRQEAEINVAQPVHYYSYIGPNREMKWTTKLREHMAPLNCLLCLLVLLHEQD